MIATTLADDLHRAAWDPARLWLHPQLAPSAAVAEDMSRPARPDLTAAKASADAADGYARPINADATALLAASVEARA